MADDGLLDPGVDLAWVIDTSAILGAAETYLLHPPDRLGPRRLSGLARHHRDPAGPPACIQRPTSHSGKLSPSRLHRS
jgi:hypothetical protein